MRRQGSFRQNLPPGEKLPQHDWYKHLGRRENVRTAKLPLKLTKAMAHLFTQAPAHYSAVQAIRRAQVRGLGGSRALARAVVGTRLGKFLEKEFRLVQGEEEQGNMRMWTITELPSSRALFLEGQAMRHCVAT